MKLMIDGVEIPWPRKIEIQVDDGGETVGPLYVEFHGGLLAVQGNAEHTSGLTLAHPESLRPDGCYSKAFLTLRGYGSDCMHCKIWDGEKLVPIEDLPQPDAVAGG